MIAKRGEATGAVVEGLDVIEDRGAGISACDEAPTMNEFILQAAPERFHRCVIVAVVPAVHRGGEVVGGELGAEARADVLHAAVGVEKQALWAAAAAARDRHEQGGDNKLGVERGVEGPA